MRPKIVYLIDTNVISEVRKGERADGGVRSFFKSIASNQSPAYISVITIGELRRGIENIRHRRDIKQASIIENWLNKVLVEYADFILDFDEHAAQVWGRLRVPNHQNLLDKQIAAIALIYNLTVVTRNTDDFSPCGVKMHNPFSQN